MRKILVFIIAVITVVCMCTSCAFTKAEESESSAAASDGSESTDTASEQSDDGVVKSRFTQDFDYDESGNITKVHVYDTDSELKATIEHIYDESGAKTEIKLMDKDGGTRCVNRYEYDKDYTGEAYISKDTYFDADDNVILSAQYECQDENSQTVMLKGYYDSQGNEIESEEAYRLIDEINSFMYE